MTGVSPRTQRLKARLRARYARETRFRWYGRAAIGVALAFLVILLGSIVTQGYTAFYAHTVTLPVYMDPARIDRSYPQGANFEQIVAEQQIRRLGVQDDDQGTRASAMKALLSSELKFQAAKMIARQPSLLGQTVPVAAPLSDDAEMYLKGKITRDQPEDQRRVSDAQMDWLDKMKASGAIRAHFNSALFTKGDSTQPELAGLLGAVVGSALMLMVTALIAFRSASAPPSGWRNIRRATASRRSSRSTSTIWPPCRPSSTACWVWRCSSTSCTCPGPVRWSGVWCWR